jgi:hypothetical protein
MSSCPSTQTYQTLTIPTFQPAPTITCYPVEQTRHVSTNPIIYFVNDIPHCCYPHQPDILMPVYMPTEMCWFPTEQQVIVSRECNVLGNIIDEVADVVGEAIKTEVDQAQNKIADEVKTRCFGLFKC